MIMNAENNVNVANEVINEEKGNTKMIKIWFKSEDIL